VLFGLFDLVEEMQSLNLIIDVNDLRQGGNDLLICSIRLFFMIPGPVEERLLWTSHEVYQSMD
jgi:hypothetical protein